MPAEGADFFKDVKFSCETEGLQNARNHAVATKGDYTTDKLKEIMETLYTECCGVKYDEAGECQQIEDFLATLYM